MSLYPVNSPDSYSEKNLSKAPDYHKTKQLSNKWSVSPYTLIGAGALLAITYLYRRAIGETLQYAFFKPLHICEKKSLCNTVFDPIRFKEKLSKVFLENTSSKFSLEEPGRCFYKEVVFPFLIDTADIVSFLHNMTSSCARYAKEDLWQEFQSCYPIQENHITLFLMKVDTIIRKKAFSFFYVE